MKNWERLPEAELDVMLTLWREDKPMTVGEIVKRLSGVRSWKSATVHVLLDRLGERGFVHTDKSGYAHLYSAAVTEEEYRRGEERSHLQRFFGGSAKNMIASMLNADSLSDADLDELAELLHEKRGERK